MTPHDVLSVPRGQRNRKLRDTAFELGRAGATNHQILAELSIMSEAMGKYTERNLYEKWTRLLAMVREVRRAGITPITLPEGIGELRLSTREGPPQAVEGGVG